MFAREPANGMRFPADPTELKRYMAADGPDWATASIDPYSGGSVIYWVPVMDEVEGRRYGPLVSAYRFPGDTPIASCAPRSDGKRLVLVADGSVRMMTADQFADAASLIPKPHRP
jgi:hypothetical protein